MHHRELLGPLCAAPWQTVRELMAVAAGEEKGFRPGMVAVVETVGGQIKQAVSLPATGRLPRVLP